MIFAGVVCLSVSTVSCFWDEIGGETTAFADEKNPVVEISKPDTSTNATEVGGEEWARDVAIAWEEQRFYQTVPQDKSFRYARIKWCEFKAISFRELDLTELYMRESALTEIDFAKSHLAGSYFSVVKFVDVDFTRAVLVNAKFSNCRMIDGTDFSKVAASSIDFEKSIAHDVSFKGAYLAGGGFEKAGFVNCDFSSSNLTGANFSKAYFEGCRFDGVVDLDTVNIKDGAVGEGNAPEFVKWALENGARQMGRDEWIETVRGK